ncbi:class I SAM-dependent methyltransferase [Rhodospirillum sp. A1_3_36]|uniref:class I SAM-dependent methyltransferase n=1 Tax=Rhodospirillum sp. A1_3_36 TaxID=3391666 RepID=UPI0039A5D2EA
MRDKIEKNTEIQRDYYERTASDYNTLHIKENDAHHFALLFLEATIELYGIQSILDIGAGTGRAALYLKKKKPNLKILSIEPVKALREIGHSSGIDKDELIPGDATQLNFSDNSFDLVCEFGALHHIHNPRKAVSEMLRVGKKAIFISDSNNFGQGSYLSRSIKQILNALKLWKVADFIKTHGKCYTITEGDGLSYSYSVFNDYKLIKNKCTKVHIMNTDNGGKNLYKTASHIALLGIK